MKKILILIALISISLSKSFAAVSVISEMEDSFKRTRGESFRAFYNSVLSHKVFSGMDKLYQQVEGDLYFVCDHYNFLNFSSESLLEEFGVKAREIVAREPFKFDSEFSYKYSTYKRIVAGSNDKFVLVGNDKGVDQEVFAQIKKEFPEKILAMYIHVVEDKKLEAGVTPYHTAFDIAANEHAKGRLSFDKVRKVGEAIYSEEKFHKVFPANSHCPKKVKELSTKPVKKLDALISGIAKKTLDHCNG